MIAGAAAGLTLGLLFAPEKGEETRRKVKAAAAEGWDEFVDATDEGWEKAQETFDDVKKGAESATSRLRARARLARRDFKDLKATLTDQAADLKDEARLKILAQLDKLEKALSKDPEETEDEWDCVVDIPVDAYIPDAYVRSEYVKLELYKRIYRIRKQEDAELIEEEMKDRFGALPKPVEQLLHVALLKEEARRACITDIRYRDGEIFYAIRNGTAVDAGKIPALLKAFPGMHLVTAKQSGFAVPHGKLIQEELLEHAEEEVRAIRTVIRTEEDGSEDSSL